MGQIHEIVEFGVSGSSTTRLVRVRVGVIRVAMGLTPILLWGAVKGWGKMRGPQG